MPNSNFIFSRIWFSHLTVTMQGEEDLHSDPQDYNYMRNVQTYSKLSGTYWTKQKNSKMWHHKDWYEL